MNVNVNFYKVPTVQNNGKIFKTGLCITFIYLTFDKEVNDSVTVKRFGQLFIFNYCTYLKLYKDLTIFFKDEHSDIYKKLIDLILFNESDSSSKPHEIILIDLSS